MSESPVKSCPERLRFFQCRCRADAETGRLGLVVLDLWCYSGAAGTQAVPVADGLIVWTDRRGRTFKLFVTAPIGPADLDAVPKLDAKSRRFVEAVIPRCLWKESGDA